ncbi:limb region 1 homolog-like protein [Salvelinus fontinalis]|uniref:limb region 1 homolog-like protein n=1 Tax=Salvelinus fontinalis TaxID=8038 RepID=UPI0024858F8F|nr:limb region 1 homolog-like protein [Salvelinus fontinalis]
MPLGLSHMFSITGSLLVKPKLLEDLDETLSCAEFEEASLPRKLTRITRFDLLGDFGWYIWLGNFVFLYNVLFAGLTSACLINTLTWTVHRELIRAFGIWEVTQTYTVTHTWLHIPRLTVSRSTIPLRLLLANGLAKIQ